MKKVVMYSKDPCPYCVRAKQFFINRNIPFEEVDLTGQEDEIQKMKDKWGWRTVPIIVADGELIGGYDDMKRLDEEGRLNEILGI